MAKDKFDPERHIVDDIMISTSYGPGYIHVVGSFDATFYLRNGTELLQCVIVELPRVGDKVRVNGAQYHVVDIMREYSDSPIHNAKIYAY